jgi:hypothetical protein
VIFSAFLAGCCATLALHELVDGQHANAAFFMTAAILLLIDAWATARDKGER